MTDELLIKQLYLGELANFTYVLGDKTAGEAIVIDPAAPWPEIMPALTQDKLVLKAVFLTHGHYDHVVGVEELDVPVYLSRKESLFYTPQARSMIRTNHGDRFSFGRFSLECLETPGHTPGCQCFLVDGNLFTGDTLFMEAVGRTDFPGGSSKVLFESLKVIKRLPLTTEIWPGHHYGHLRNASLAEVKQMNPFLSCGDLIQFEGYLS
ncbi:MAG: MBL fold metallo-hydrolase [Candidatus Omnitrophota bacterium]